MTNGESLVLLRVPGSWVPAFNFIFTCNLQLSCFNFLRRSAIINCHVRLQRWFVGTKVHVVLFILELSYPHRHNRSHCAYLCQTGTAKVFSPGTSVSPRDITPPGSHIHVSCTTVPVLALYIYIWVFMCGMWLGRMCGGWNLCNHMVLANCGIKLKSVIT